MKKILILYLLFTAILFSACQKQENFDVLPSLINNKNTGPINVPNENIKVYVVGGDNATGTFAGYLDAPDAWRYILKTPPDII